MARLSITILNWKKYNYRADVQHPSWMRIQNSLFEDPDLYSLKPEEMCAFIYILCMASKKNDETITVNEDHARVVGRLSKKILLSAISKLRAIGVIRYVDDTSAPVDVTPTDGSVLDMTNKQTNKQTNGDFDFEKAFEGYPRKEGKTNGIKICRKDIRDQIDYENLLKAIFKYSKIVREERREKKYIKQFSTFMATWREWIPKSNEKEKPAFLGNIPNGIPEELLQEKTIPPEEQKEKVKEMMKKFRGNRLDSLPNIGDKNEQI